MAILYKLYKPYQFLLYDERGDMVCLLHNEVELNEIRLQIVQQKLSGYFVEYKGEKAYLHPNGSLSGIVLPDKNSELIMAIALASCR